MAVSKIRVSELPRATTTNGLVVLGVQSNNRSVQADMELLRGNTGDNAFELWLKQPGNSEKTYEDYLAYNRQPATDAAESVSRLEARIEESEQERITSESNREEAERLRMEAENLRVTTENSRKEREIARVEAESSRVEVENARVIADSQRDQNENAREVAEGLRKEAESARVVSENIRQTQEEERQQNTGIAIQNADNATDRLNSLSDHRDEIRDSYWWRWNEETGEYENTGIKARGDVMYATFEIDDTGTLVMSTPNGYEGPVFELIGSELYVNINE